MSIPQSSTKPPMLRLFSLLVMLLATLISTTSAFPVVRKSPVVIKHGMDTKRATPLTKTSLSMSSSLAEDKPKRKWLPPPPDDFFIMAGDIASLFLYSFLDHSVNDAYLATFQKGHHLDQMADELGVLVGNSVPVWLNLERVQGSVWDVNHIRAGLAAAQIQYSPALSSFGSSAVLLTSGWLLGGYLWRAFSSKNTLECNTQRMLLTTLRAWATAVLLVSGVALGSDTWADCHCPLYGKLNGLTKCDIDFIFDSLTVLLSWRFMMSWMLGANDSK